MSSIGAGNQIAPSKDNQTLSDNSRAGKTPKSKKKDSELSADPWQENMHIFLQN